MKSAIRDYDGFRKELAKYADDDYREFSMKGIPSDRPFVGVRIPVVREIVNCIAPEYYEEFLKVEPVAFEEVLARGFLICKLSYDEMLLWFDSQVSYIDDWASCDTFCSALRKLIHAHLDEFLELKVERLLDDSHEYAVRAGLVLLKCAYVDFGHLQVIFDKTDKLALREEYYIRMAIAWLMAECFIKFPEETLGFMRVSRLPKWTYNKMISKICDSYRVDSEMKEVVRRMRKK
ncbi:DNA alkylation repair protein [Candidatus Saccharibacteria bacterium]|nr:DNA alkylation repair protein [Candidatus Saccharibacteria bacterium]